MASNAQYGQFEIDVLRLEEGPLTIQKEIEIETLGRRLSFCEYEVTPRHARVDLEVQKVGDGALVRGRIDAELETQCGTCLASTRLDLQPTFSAYFSENPESEESDEGVELTPEELEKECFDGQKLRLDDLVFDTLMLELPMTPKCGPNCKGLAGKQDDGLKNQIDHRLDPLARLRIEKES
jgi:uncharacterized protein